ncbi:toll/interleukin-1 receptor domain-containing protein [Actinosynnema sp. NPDC050436]|uniref:toll/interleukin-1 receptor domain-containing protein n=1 Tax=Actinosynnema sp. NPDC050436 TaxID=3155659 RepID=UPI0033FDDC07
MESERNREPATIRYRRTAVYPRDVFISHASADKEKYARPLDRELQKRGVSTWLDEVQLGDGENFVQSIAWGLERAELVACLITPRFLDRRWTAKELSVALSGEISSGTTRVIPVFDVDNEESVFSTFPLLRDKTYVDWKIGPDRIAHRLATRFRRRPAEWHVFWHEQACVGPIWMRILPTEENQGSLHRVRVLWGPYTYSTEVRSPVRGPLSLTHHKLECDSLPMYVATHPAAVVTIGQGSAPDEESSAIDEGWVRLRGIGDHSNG